MKTAFAICLICACVFLSGCFANGPESRVTPDQAHAIANKELASAGLETVEWTFVELHDDPNNRCLSYQHPDTGYMADLEEFKRILAGHRYYLVMYDPAPDIVFGSVTCIFVDEVTGNILAKGLF
jgi:outer membrane lipoprotein-sorting protein